MSHSQFHSIRVLILRHAWLNLLDKHMTTGRINQVTTLRKAKHNSAPERTEAYTLPTSKMILACFDTEKTRIMKFRPRRHTPCRQGPTDS